MAHRESEEHEQHWFWIGLNRRNPMDNGSWKWSDGLAVSNKKHHNPAPLGAQQEHIFTFNFLLVTQFTYQNFGRYYYNIRQCAAADLGSMTWLAMHCDSELDWICKIPRGTNALHLSSHLIFRSIFTLDSMFSSAQSGLLRRLI